MYFDAIIQPIINVADIKVEEFGLPAGFKVAKLSYMEDWTLNVLKTLDKEFAIKTSGNEVQWKKMLSMYFDTFMDKAIQKIFDMVAAKSKNYKELYTASHG